jgi:hypothetical protein
MASALRPRRPGPAGLLGLVAWLVAVGTGLVAGLIPASLLAQPAGPEVVITAYAIPTPNSLVYPTGLGGGGIAAGPDGALWFTAIDANQIGRVQLRSAPRGVVLPRTGAAD